MGNDSPLEALRSLLYIPGIFLGGEGDPTNTLMAWIALTMIARCNHGQGNLNKEKGPIKEKAKQNTWE